MSRYRYSQWDGTQQPLADLEIAERLADAFSDRLLSGMSTDDALRRLLERGMPGEFGGLQNLRNRLRELREQIEQQSRLGGALDDLAVELSDIVETERGALNEQEGTEPRFKEALLDNLPTTPAGKLRELQQYEFTSAEAAKRFAGLMESLRQQIMESYLGQIAQGMQSMTEDDMARLKDMLADLNHLLEQRRAGTGPSDEDFATFMERHGEFFPDNPQNLDELLEGLAKRAAAMSRFMASLSPEQRSQLEQLAQDLLGDLDLGFEMARLGDNLRATMPGLAWDQPAHLDGDQPLGMGHAVSEIERLGEFEAMEACMRQDYSGASIDDVDVDDVRRLLGDDAAHDVERLKEIERMLSDAGLVSRRQGRIELTPRGIRKLGERALATVFERLELERPGSHDTPDAGGMGEPTGAVRPWRFGDPFRVDIHATLSNAVLRSGPSRDGVVVHPDDFALAEAESRTSTATALLLDMSRSMPLRGHWEHARRMAFALHALITSQYPEDRLHVVGFSDYARTLQPNDLAQVDWEPVYGTNMEHAFRLAGRLLAKDPAANKQVLLVTDGEPTAHLVGDQVFFHWPPVPETIQKTFTEALRLARSGVTMNIFMLEDEPGLVRFIDRLASTVRGRVFAIPDQDLGAVILRDYVRRRAA